MPKVSVILPVYQADAYLGRTLRSLFSQTLDDIEYIIVDDASTDRSMEIVDAILSQYPGRESQVKIIKHPHNTGVGTARHDGLMQATGEYLIHCDADDWLEPEAYELMYDMAVDNDADIVVCDFVMEHDNRSSLSRHNTANRRSDTQLLEDILVRRAHAAVWNKMIRRSFILHHHIDFTQGLRVCEDLMFCLHALICNPKISYLQRPLYHYDRNINPNPL
ncbi:MAG: glycosyltransferase [Muribaculaceae bacterium]|nr:glycosyltransferase [Muribaculaceae bacterium]